MFVTDLELVLKFPFTGITRTRKTFPFPSQNSLRIRFCLLEEMKLDVGDGSKCTGFGELKTSYLVTFGQH